MKIIAFLAVFIFSFSIQAEEIEKSHVDKMIDSMVQQGILPQAQAAQAKAKLQNISDEEWGQINKQAAVMAEKYKSENKDVGLNANAAAENINFDGKMFKDIQNSISAQLKEADLEEE